MVTWTVLGGVIVLVACALGVGGFATSAPWIAQIGFVVALLVAIVAGVAHAIGGRARSEQR